MELTWLSQGGFLFEADGKRVILDPYLSDDLRKLGHIRMTIPPLSYEDLKPDVVIFTHDHLDHYDPVTVEKIVMMYSDCKFAGPISTYKHHESLGYDTSKFTILNLGDKYDVGGISFYPVKALHSDPFAVGFIIKYASKTLYISGDTLYSPELHNDIVNDLSQSLDLAIVCINGKLGNMPWSDAVKLVEEIQPRVAMPMHYGLFATNTEDPTPFKNTLTERGIKVILPKEGESFSI